MLTRKGIVLSARSRALTIITGALVGCALTAFASPAFAATYNPLNVISYDVWRASSSMTVADIQSFLDAQTGPLKSYKTYDYHDRALVDSTAPTHHTTAKTAAQIIWEAARAWNLNPKVILSTLQKEQSLLTLSNSADAARLVKAMGCGVYGAIDPKTGLTTNRSPGFGHQIWDGARVFSTYETTYHWVPGMHKTVTVSATHASLSIVPVNASTFALYTYTPYYPQVLFWNVYTRYFGDPQSPARLLPVYRFRNRTTGAYYYTASEGTRYNLISKSWRTWEYGGVAFSEDTSAVANTALIYRLENTKTHAYFYTTSVNTKNAWLAKRPVTWRLSGTVGRVSKVAVAGAARLYKVENKHTRAVLLTRYASTVKSLTTGHDPKWWNRGVFCYLAASAVTTPPVGP
jgi:hypothetical protein